MGLTVARYVSDILESNMYVVVKNRKAIVVDPHENKKAEAYLKREADEVLILLTHEHFDHTSGVNWAKDRFQAKLMCQKNAMDPRIQKHCNRPLIVCMKLQEEGKTEEATLFEQKYPSYTYEAEILFEDEIHTEWFDFEISCIHLPGHSPASCMISIDKEHVFTGDSLIPGIPTIVRWPFSSKKDYYEISLGRLHEIPMSVKVYPGHGEPIARKKLRFLEGKGYFI